MTIKIAKETEILVFTGPESSGKTTCAERLSINNNLPLVEEYARTYLDLNGRTYTFEDIQKIALTQIDQERVAHQDNALIICDTDIVTLEIWALEKFKTSLGISDALMKKKHYFLCYPDIPWEPDPLRENPEDRERLFEVYEDYLQQLGVPFTVLKEGERKQLTFQPYKDWEVISNSENL